MSEGLNLQQIKDLTDCVLGPPRILPVLFHMNASLQLFLSLVSKRFFFSPYAVALRKLLALV
jgi:hypothetical protein